MMKIMRKILPRSKVVILMIVVLLIFLISFAASSLFKKSNDGKLVGPDFNQLLQQSSATPAPYSDIPAYNPPKEFKYDRSTNLQAELESIDPQISTNDFEELKALIQSIK